MRRYHIPVNFAAEGKIGNFPIRNIIEACILLACVGVPLIGYVPLPIRAKICVCIIVLGVTAVMSLRGINGLSLFQFFADFISYNRTKRVYGTPKSSDKIGREQRLAKKKNKAIKEQKKAKKKQAKADKKETRRKRREE